VRISCRASDRWTKATKLYMQFPGASPEDRAQLRADAAELGRLGNRFEAEGFGRDANTWHGWKRPLDKEGFDLGTIA